MTKILHNNHWDGSHPYPMAHKNIKVKKGKKKSAKGSKNAQRQCTV